MEYDDKLAIMFFIHFGTHLHKKRLKCENCLDYQEKICNGKGYKYKDVINCMSEHAESSEILMRDNIKL